MLKISQTLTKTLLTITICLTINTCFADITWQDVCSEWLQTDSYADVNYDGIVNLKDLDQNTKVRKMGYDNTSVELNYGRGYSDTNPQTLSAGPITAANPDFIFAADGIMTDFKSVLRSSNATPVSVASLCVISGTPGNYVVEQLVDISTEVNTTKPAGAGKFTVTVTGLSVPVSAGEFLAVYMDANAGFYNITEANSQKTLFTTTSIPVDGQALDLATTATIKDVPMEAIYISSTRLPFDDDNSASGWGNGDILDIPTYRDNPFYIVIKGVQVPDTESLAIDLKFTNQSDQSLVDVETYTINMTADTIADSAATSNSLTGQDGEKFDLHLYFDPANREEDLFYVNFENGQGGLDVSDFEHKSLNSRQVVQIPADIAVNNIRWIEFTNAGGNATIDSVVVCREPLLIIGDSFTGTYSIANSLSVLSRVGLALVEPGVFGEDRYGILGGCSDGKVTTASSGSTPTHAIRDRWNSVGNDMCNFRDVVVCLVNGPGVNDISIIDGTYTDIAISSRAYQVAGDVQRMAGDAGSETIIQNNSEAINDVILAEMIPLEISTGQARTNEQDCQKAINNALNQASFGLQVPITLTFYQYAALGFGYDNDDGLHPTALGAAWIAGQMAYVYENNTIARDPAESVTRLSETRLSR